MAWPVNLLPDRANGAAYYLIAHQLAQPDASVYESAPIAGQHGGRRQQSIPAITSNALQRGLSRIRYSNRDYWSNLFFRCCSRRAKCLTHCR